MEAARRGRPSRRAAAELSRQLLGEDEPPRVSEEVGGDGKLGRRQRHGPGAAAHDPILGIQDHRRRGERKGRTQDIPASDALEDRQELFPGDSGWQERVRSPLESLPSRLGLSHGQEGNPPRKLA